MPTTERTSFVQILDDEPQSQDLDHGELHSGSICPRCGEGSLDYNSLLELECPVCRYTFGGGGCT